MANNTTTSAVINAQIDVCNDLLETLRRCSAPSMPFSAGAAGAIAIVEMKIAELEARRKELKHEQINSG